MKKTLILILALALITGCSSGFKKKKLLYRSLDVAYYKLKKKNIKQAKSLKNKINHPFQADAVTDFTNVLKNISYKKTSSIGSFEDKLFKKKEAEQIGQQIQQAFSRLAEDEFLVAVKVSNETDSVMPSYTLTTVLGWVENDNKLNLVFGDVDTYITTDRARNYNAWSSIDPIVLSHKVDNSVILKGNGYEFKKVNGFDNNRWVVVNIKPAAPEDKTPPNTRVIIKKEP